MNEIKFGQAAHSTVSDNPNFIGSKWRFFEFTAVLKNISIKNHILSSFALFISLFIVPIICVYPIVWVEHTKLPDSNLTDLTYFPNANSFKDFVPGKIPMQIIDTFYVIFLVIPILSFCICFFNTDYLLYLHPFLSQQIISIFYPFNCIVFSYYVISYSYNSVEFTGRFQDFMMIFLFIIYLILYITLTYIENNSIINPNAITGERFLGFTTVMPIVSLISIFISVQSQNLGPAVYYPLFIVAFVILLISIYYVFYEVPMLNMVLNPMISSDYIVLLIILALDFMVIGFEIKIDIYMMLFLPLLFVILFIGTRYLYERRRIDIQQFLEMFDREGFDYSVSAFATTLESMSTERQMRMMIHEGLQSGNKTVTSPPFIQYCLEKFPKSSWMASYVSFVFVISWGTNPIIYKFLLHTLSLDYFGIRNMQLFQAIYCMMQTTQTISPKIARELDDYRMKVVQFAAVHRSFWRAVLLDDPAKFNDAFHAYHNLFRRLSRMLRILTMKYPYNSSVASENALFHADFHHNFHKSSECYSRAVQLLDQKRSLVVNEIFYSYSMVIPIATPKYKEDDLADKGVDELRFISMIEQHDRALRYMTVVSPNDEYLQAISHAFSVPTNHEPVEISFEKVRAFLLYLIFVISIIMFNIFCIVIVAIVWQYNSDRDTYDASSLMMERMILFRNEVHLARQDVRLLSSILTEDYNDILNNSIYYNISDDDWKATLSGLYILAIRHVNDIEIALTRHVLRFNARKLYSEIPFTTPNCNTLNCTLSYLYSGLHFILFFMLNNKDGGKELNQRLITSLDNFTIPLVALCDNVFKQMVKSHNATIYKQIYKHRHQGRNLMIIIFSILLFILVSIIYLIHSMRKNLFAVIKTIQKSMLKSVSSLFDKMLTLEQRQKQVVHDVNLTKALLILITSYTGLICTQVFLLTQNRNLEHSLIAPNNSLTKMVEPTNITAFATFATAVIEHIVRDGINRNGVLQLNFINSLALTVYQSCLYYILNNTCYNCYTQTMFYQNQNKITNEAVVYTILIDSAVLICVYIYYMSKYFKIDKSIEGIMKFIPLSARKSNPVLAKIMIGQWSHFDEVSSFAEDSNTSYSSLDHFAIVCMDPLENVIEIKGDIKKYFPFVPQTLNDIRQYVLNNSHEIPDAVNAFFDQKKPLETRSCAIDGEREIAMTFSRKGAILLIKDDAHHHSANNKQRIFQKLQEIVKDGNDRRKPANFPQTILIILDLKSKNAHRAMLKKLESIGKVVDTRFMKLVCVIEPSKAQEIPEIIKNLQESYGRDFRGIIHAGGAISVLQSSMVIEKSRVFGQTYDEAKILLSNVPPGGLAVSEVARTSFNISV